MGDKVWVKRSSGEMEHGWTLYGISDDGLMVKTKDELGRTMTKVISGKEFEEWQKEGKKKKIKPPKSVPMPSSSEKSKLPPEGKRSVNRSAKGAGKSR